MINNTDPTTAWKIQLSLTNGEVVRSVIENDSRSDTVAFTGLLPGTEYRVQVAGINSRGIGEYSEAVSVRTSSCLAVQDGGNEGERCHYSYSV